MDTSIEVIKKNVENCLVAGSSLVITNQEEYDNALEVGKKVNKLLKMIEDDEKKITKPINDSLKMIREKYRPFKNQVEAVKAEIKNKMETWFAEETKKKRIEEERLAKRLEKGTMKEETVINKMATLEENKVQTNGGMTSKLVVEVIDITLVPKEYLLIDEAKIKEDFRAGKEIAGVKCEYVKTARF